MKLSAKIRFTLSYLVPDITLRFVILCRTRMQYRTPFHNCTYKKTCTNNFNTVKYTPTRWTRKITRWSEQVGGKIFYDFHFVGWHFQYFIIVTVVVQNPQHWNLSLLCLLYTPSVTHCIGFVPFAKRTSLVGAFDISSDSGNETPKCRCLLPAWSAHSRGMCREFHPPYRTVHKTNHLSPRSRWVEVLRTAAVSCHQSRCRPDFWSAHLQNFVEPSLHSRDPCPLVPVIFLLNSLLCYPTDGFWFCENCYPPFLRGGLLFYFLLSPGVLETTPDSLCSVRPVSPMQQNNLGQIWI